MFRKEKKKKHAPLPLWQKILYSLGVLVLLIGMGLAGFFAYFALGTSSQIAPTMPTPVPMRQYLQLIYQVENRLYKYNWSTGESSEFAILRGYDADNWENLQVSPDAQFISYAASTAENEAHKDIFTQHIERGQVYNLSNTEHETETNYQWTADGRVVFATGGDILLSDATGQTINIVDLNYVVQNSLIDWSDHKQSAAVWFSSSNTQSSLISVDTPFSVINWRHMPEAQGVYSAIDLSADGRWLAYAASQPSTVFISSISPNSEPQPISAISKEDYHLAWSENSEWLVYDSYLPDTDNWDIQLVYVSTGQIQNLSASLERDERYPVWLPNSTILVQVENGYGYFQVTDGIPTYYDLPLPEDALFIRWLVQ